MLNVFTLYSLASMLLPCMVYQLIVIVKARRNGQRCQAVHVIWIYIFLIYIWMVFQVDGDRASGRYTKNGYGSYSWGSEFCSF